MDLNCCDFVLADSERALHEEQCLQDGPIGMTMISLETC